MTDERQIPAHQQFSGEFSIAYKSVGELFCARMSENPGKVFLICPGKDEESFTRRELYDTFMNAAGHLRELGLARGDRFSLVFYNSSEFLAYYFGGLSAGITVVPINPDLSAQEISYIVRDSRSKAVVYSKVLEAKIASLRGGIPGCEVFVSIGGLADIPDGTRHHPNPMELHRKSPELLDEAVIIYTSGTTGNPKGVLLSHMNLLADAKAISEWFEFSESTRALCILPLFHNNGQITTLLAPLFAGGSAVIVKGKASLMAFWALVEKYGATFSSVMASILSILLSLNIERKDKTLAAILCGGQVLTRSVQDRFEERFGVPVFEGFGLTETTSFSCINDFPRQKRKFGSIGRPLPVNDMAILDENDREVAANEEGQICIRGRNVACEYLGLDDRNRVSFANGWFHSGDFGYRDEEGYFYFRGRKDFLIIKGGENIYPAELENVIYRHECVAECAVIGIPDKLLGEDLCAFVKLKEKGSVSARDLKDYCKGKIAAYKQPKVVIMIDDLPDMSEIPKGPTKKVLYRILKEYYLKNLVSNVKNPD